MALMHLETSTGRTLVSKVELLRRNAGVEAGGCATATSTNELSRHNAESQKRNDEIRIRDIFSSIEILKPNVVMIHHEGRAASCRH